MRRLWACGAVLSVVGLVGCTSTSEEAGGAPPTAKPSPVMIAISGGIDVMLPGKGAGAEINAPCTPPPNAKTQLGQEISVTDGEGAVLGTGKIENGITRGSAMFKQCSVDFSFKVSGAPENYKLIIGDFAPMQYTREDIRRGLSFYETEQGTLAAY